MENNGIPEIILDEKDMIDVTDRQTPAMRPLRWSEASQDPTYQSHAEAISAALELAARQGPSEMFARVAAGLDVSRDRWLGLR